MKMKFSNAVLLAAALFSVQCLVAQKPLTVESIFGSDRLNEKELRDVQWIPGGGAFSFADKDDAGNTVVWKYDAAYGRKTRLLDSSRVGIVPEFRKEKRFSLSSYRWSPDSKHIAFFELDQTPEMEFPVVDFIPIRNRIEWLRYPKAGTCNAEVRIGVVPANGGPIVWMDTGEVKDMYIPRIHWLKDGNRLAIQRLNRNQNRLDLLIADIRTGQTNPVLSEENPSGWIDANDDLAFLKDNRGFLWTSERSNWKHLYLYNIEGKLLRQLTGGNWNVERLNGVDEKGGWVYFTASEKSSIESHLYRVGLDESNPIYSIDRYRGGLFLIHGSSDDNVHLANTMQMVQAIQNAKKPFQLMVYPRKMHGISGKKIQVHLYNAMTEFLLKQL